MTALSTAITTAQKDSEAFRMANCIRSLTISAVEAAKSGHPGAPMGLADAATVLWTKHLKFNSRAPEWPDRDRFVLSNGHASMLHYSLLPKGQERTRTGRRDSLRLTPIRKRNSSEGLRANCLRRSVPPSRRHANNY